MSNNFTDTSIYFTLFKKVGLNRFLISLFSNFGGFWLFIEPASFFLPESLKFGLGGYLSLVLISLAFAIIQNLPKISISYKLSSPDTDIEIKVGDIFQENGHLVIGFNDVFDTELGEVIRDSSVQGQFLKRVYRGKQDKLDSDIETALQEDISNRSLDPDKNRGKAWRYPIGTTITLGSYEKRYFLTAYGYMKNDLTVDSNSDYISTALDKLWQEVRRKCHGTDVAIPIIGSDLARSGLSRMQLSKLIITSFVSASKRKFITRKLTLMIYTKDLDSVDFYELQEFLKSICF
ncbi:hypothetical protein H6G04_28820 [Calothrix membranacea FACHB-236]|nr:hypothetical protein [Calothrix membranacea FACHB-236]